MNEVTAPHGDFRDGLRDVANRLSLPLTTRLRILRELQADHADTVARLMERGIPEAEARHRARTALLPDGETLAALERLHQPLYRRLTRNVENHRLQQLERWALLGTTAVVVALGVSALLRVDLFAAPSPFLWPVLGLASVGFSAVVAKAFDLWVRGEHDSPGRGLWMIPLTGGCALWTGLQGVLWDAFRLAGRLQAGSSDPVALTTRWLIRDGGLLAVSILVGLASVVAWYVLAQWAAIVEDDRRAVLGPDTAPLQDPSSPTSATSIPAI